MYRLIAIFTCLLHLPIKAEKFIVASQNFDYYPHYNFQSNTNKGLVWAILEKFSDFSGHQFDYQPMPVLRLQRELEKGRIDLVYPDNPLFNNNLSFAKGKYYSDTIVTTLGGTLIKRARLGASITNIGSLSIPLGFTPQIGWQALISSKQVELIPVNKPLAELQLLAMDRVDAAEVDYFVSQFQQKKNPKFNDFVFDPNLPHSEVEFKLSTIKHPWLIDEINQFIKTQPEAIKKLKLQYGILEPQDILQSLKSNSPVELGIN